LWAKFSYGQTLLYFYALKGNLYCLRANFIVSSHLIASQGRDAVRVSEHLTPLIASQGRDAVRVSEHLTPLIASQGRDAV
ncbi:hypothetical protein ACB376_20585, partial [Klebsiella electrica]